MDIGTIKVRLQFDESSVDSAFADMKNKAKSFNSLLLTPTVDDRQLTALNKHLDLKIQHYKQVQRYFNSNPLKIKSDLSVPRESVTQRRSQGAQYQSQRNQTEIKLNSRGFEASFKSTTDSFLSRFARTEIQLKNPKFNFMSLITSPLKSFADEFTRETSRSFARGTEITKASNRAGRATGKFAVERGTEFGDHAAKNLLMYEDGLKGLKRDIDTMSQSASDFLHPEPFYAAIDKVETRFAKFLHDTFYGDGIGKAFNNVGADIENGIQAKLDKIKGLASIVNTNVAGEIKGLAGKSGKELTEAIRNLSPEAKPLYEKLTTKARQVAIDEGITKKKDQAARVGQLLSNPESALKLSAEVAKDMMKESGAEGLLRPLNVLLRTFRVTTNSVRKMNALQLENVAESMVEQYKAIVPKVTEAKKQLVIYASAASDFGRGAEEHAPIIQAQFPGAQVVSPTFDEYDFKQNHEGSNVFQNMARSISTPLKGGLIAGGGGEENKGAEILSDTLSGYLFGYSKSVARIMATIQAALDQGYEMQDIQLVGFSQGSQVVRNAVDVMANLGQDVKGVGIGLADYLDALVPKNPNHQSFYAKEDSLNLPAQIGLIPTSGKEVQMNAMNTKVDGHALFQIASQPEFLSKMTEHGMKGVREGDYDPKAMSNHLLNYQRLIAPARTSQLISNLIGGKDVGEGIASRPTDPYKRYKAVEDFDSLLSMLKGGANKILRDYSPKNLEETANKLGVDPDAEFLGVGNKLYIEYEKSIADLAGAMGVSAKDVKANLKGLEAAGDALASYKAALASLDNGTADLAQTQVSISELLKSLPNGDLKATLSQLVVDIQSQGQSALEVSKSNDLLSNAVRITSFTAKDEDFINDPKNPNQVPQPSIPVYDKSGVKQPQKVEPQPVPQPIKDAVKSTESKLESLKEIDKTLIKAINELIKSAEELQSVDPELARNFAITAQETLKPQIEGVQRYLDNSTSSDPMFSKAAGAKGNFSQSQKRIDAVLTNTEGKSTNALEDLVGIADSLQGMSGYNEELTFAIKKQIDSVRQMFTVLNTQLKRGDQPALATDVIADVKQFQETIDQIMQGLGDVVPDSLKSSASSAKRESTKAYKTASSVSLQMQSPLQRLQMPEIEGAEDVAKGLHNAMTTAADQQAEDAANIAIAGQKAYKEEEEIRSPSRKWFRYGQYLMEGLSNGMSSLSILDPITAQIDAAADYLKNKASLPAPILQNQSITANANNMGYQGGQQVAQGIDMGVNALNQGIAIAQPVVQQGMDIAGSGISGFLTGLNQQLEQLGTQIPGMDAVMGFFENIQSIGVGLAAFTFLQTFQDQLMEFGQASFDAALQYESFTTLLNNTSASSGAVASSIDTINSTVARLNINLAAARDGYVKLQASSLGTDLEGRPTDKIFGAVSQASSVYQLDEQQTERVYMAIEQMASKGTVSAEELRQQLGESLPGAFQIAARSMGLTTKEFNKLLETGQIASSDFLPKFAAQLSSETSQGVAGAANSAQGSMNKLNNAILRLQETAGKPILDLYRVGLKLITPVIEYMPGVLTLTAAAVALLGAQLLWMAAKPVTTAIAGLLKLATGATTVAGAMKVLMMQALKFGAWAGGATLAIGGLQTAFAILTDSGGKFGAWAKQSKQDLKEIQDAAAKARGEISGLGTVTDKDLKNEGYMADSVIGAIFGKDLTNKTEEFLQKNFKATDLIPMVGYGVQLFDKVTGKKPGQGRTSANIKAENMAIQASEDIVTKNSILSSNLTQFTTAREVGRLNREIEQKQLEAKGFEMANPLETTAIREQKEEIDKLIIARDKVNEPLAIQTQKNEAIIGSATAAIKELKEKMAAGSITTAQYESGLANYNAILKAGERDQKKFNDALNDSNKQFSDASTAIAKAITQLEDYMSNTEFNKLTRDAQIAMSQLNGSLTSEQAEYTKGLSDQVSLLEQIATKQQAIKDIKDKIGETNIDQVLAAFGLRKETVGQAQLEAAQSQATTPQQKASLEAMSQIVTLETDLAGMTGQYYDTAVQLQQQIKDTNKSIAEYFKESLEAFEDTKNAIAESNISAMATRMGNNIKRSVVKFQQSFATDLLDSIVSMLEIASRFVANQLKEKTSIIEATREWQQSQQQSNELGQGLVNGVSAVGRTDTPASYNAEPLTVYSGGKSVKTLGKVNAHHTYQTSKDGQGRMVIDIVIADSAGRQKGVSVPSPVSGTLVRRTDPGGYGNYVNIIDEAGKVLARIAHLDKFVAKSGQRINVGDIIGTQGHTGRTIPRGEAGTHLHIEAAKKILDAYIPMLATGKGYQSGSPTYNRLDGSVGSSQSSSSYRGGAIGGIPANEVAAFGRKAIQIANEVGIEPKVLLGIIGAESGFQPAIRHIPKKGQKSSGATGLIQFMPKTAEGLGTTTDKLKKMSGVEQLDWVKAFFKDIIKSTGVDFRKVGMMGAYGAVFANDPFNKKGVRVTDGQSTLANTARRAQTQYGGDINQFIKAAGSMSQSVAQTASSVSSMVAQMPQTPGRAATSPQPLPNTNFEPLAGVGASQLAQAQSTSLQNANAKIADARNQKILADSNDTLAMDQERAKAQNAIKDARRQMADDSIAQARDQEDFMSSLGYATPSKESESQIREIKRKFEDSTKGLTRGLEDLIGQREVLKIAIDNIKKNPSLDIDGQMMKGVSSALKDVEGRIEESKSGLKTESSNRNLAIQDVIKKASDAEVRRVEANAAQMNELSSQTLNAMADAAQRVLDINPDAYTKDDPIALRLQAQQNDLQSAYKADLAATRDMVQNGEKTAEEASIYYKARKELLDRDIANATEQSKVEQRAIAEAREARAKERVERLRQTLANNEARNFEFRQELNALSNEGVNNQINSIRNSARNTPMSYALDTASKMENDLKVAEAINSTQSKLRELALEQRENQNRLAEINQLTAIADKSPEQISQLQQLQVEQGSARSSEQIQKLIDLTQQLNAQTLDGLRQELDNLVSDRAKERLNNMIEIESNVFNSGQDLLGAKSSYASTLGFGVNAQKYQKEAAINQQGFDYSAALRGIDDFAEKTGASADTVAQLKANLESLNDIKLKGIEAEFNPFTQGLGEVQQGFASTIAGVITGSQLLSEGLNNMLGSIAESLANLAAQWITNELFGSLFSMGGLGGGSQQSGGLFGGGGGIGSVFSGLLGFAEGGEVPFDPASNALRSLPGSIGKALTKEGSNSVLAALTPGERVLTISEARLYNALHPTGIASSTKMPQISNFATGGMVGVTQGSYSNMGNTTVNVPVTIEGGNSDNIDPVAMAKAVRVAVLSELGTQSRPNGMLNKRR